MTDIIEIENQYYIRAQSSLADNRTRVLMRGDAFAVFDRHGDLHPIGLNEQGLFYKEARHLSKSVLRLASRDPVTTPELDWAASTAPFGDPLLNDRGEVIGIVVAKINAMQPTKTAPEGFRECPRAQRFASDDKANGDNAVGQTRAPWSSSSGPGNG